MYFHPDFTVVKLSISHYRKYQPAEWRCDHLKDCLLLGDPGILAPVSACAPVLDQNGYDIRRCVLDVVRVAHEPESEVLLYAMVHGPYIALGT